MAEKRPHPSGDDAHNDAKRSRSNNGSPAPSGANGSRAIPNSIQEQIAAAKARAAAARERITGSNVGSNSPAPPPSAPAQSPAEAARAKIEAMKARVAAATARSGATTQSSSPMTSAPPRDNEESLSRARGGLGIGLHPALLGDMSQDARSKGRGAMGPKFGTTMGNRRPDSPTDRPGSGAKGRKQLDLSGPSAEDIKSNPYYDASLSGTGAVPKGRKSKELVFNQKGKFIAQAAALRRQAQLEEMKRKIAESTRKANLEEDRSEQAFLVKDVPSIEWWDEGLIEGAVYPDFDDDAMTAEAKCKINTDDSIITRYVQHPVLLEPPDKNLAFVEKPLMLTKTEMKKMRKHRRMADLQEKQAKVRLGLVEPEPPKIKKSNLMRVLGEQAVKDPTAVEARVNREIAERKEKHEAENEARKLTKEERHEKTAEKAERDAAKGLHQSLYRIDSLAYSKNRNKIDMNAKQHNDLTGMMITNPKFCIVIIEAGQRTTDFFEKLMLRRIQWTENAPATAPIQGKKERGPAPAWLNPETEDGFLKDLSENKCVQVWKGEVKERAFKRWTERDTETDGAAQQTLEKSKMQNMWMLARNWSSE